MICFLYFPSTGLVDESCPVREQSWLLLRVVRFEPVESLFRDEKFPDVFRELASARDLLKIRIIIRKATSDSTSTVRPNLVNVGMYSSLLIMFYETM